MRLDKWNTYMQTQPEATGCSTDKTESSRCFLMTVPLWFSEAARWRWSPRECPQSPITCVRKLQTDRPPAATTGGSGSATSTKKIPNMHNKNCIRQQYTEGKLFNQIVISLCVCCHAAWRSGERRQRSVQRHHFGEKGCGPSDTEFGHPDHFCVQGLSFIRYQPSLLISQFVLFFQHLPGRERKQHKKNNSSPGLN